jgi:hypothetical protein
MMAVILLWGFVAATTALAGDVTGTVVGAPGGLLAGASVTISARVHDPRQFNAYTASTTTSSNGSYTFARVPNGVYSVCAQARNESLLNGCVWHTRASRPVLVRGDERATVPAITLEAHVLTVVVRDEQGHLSVAANRNSARALTIGVYDPQQGMIPVSWKRAAGPVHTYELPVPYDRKMILMLRANGLRVDDDRGVQIDPQKGLSRDVEAKRGQTLRPVTFTIRSNP